MKLTRAQWFTLVDASDGGMNTYLGYKPAIRLVELGLCQWRKTGIFGRKVLDITDAGKETLAGLPRSIAQIIAEIEITNLEGE